MVDDAVVEAALDAVEVADFVVNVDRENVDIAGCVVAFVATVDVEVVVAGVVEG